ARTPKADRLPDPVKALVRRNAVEVRNAQFGRDAEALIAKIKEAGSDKPIAVNRWRATAAAVAALLLIGWIAVFVTGRLPWAVHLDPREQVEQANLAPAQAEEERKAKAAAEAEATAKAEQAEKERLAAAKAEADAEAKRKAAEAEQQRLKEEEERQAK